jgi:hypothetical protein
MNNPINPFEYVSMLISLILGLGLTQTLSSITDLLYHYKKVKFYWPHTLWVVFVLFLLLQDWFITFQLKNKWTWTLPELGFVLLYPILLFAVAKMLLPNHVEEENEDMEKFYFGQFNIIFMLVALSITSSILFNVFLLKATVSSQVHLILFLLSVLFLSIRKIKTPWVHKLLALVVTIGMVASVILERDLWVIK